MGTTLTVCGWSSLNQGVASTSSFLTSTLSHSLTGWLSKTKVTIPWFVLTWQKQDLATLRNSYCEFVRMVCICYWKQCRVVWMNAALSNGREWIDRWIVTFLMVSTCLAQILPYTQNTDNQIHIPHCNIHYWFKLNQVKLWFDWPLK